MSARRPKLSRRVSTAVAWPVGVGFTSWRYLWRTTPMHRSEEAADACDGPPPVPPGVDRDDLQGPELGVGVLFHRRYRARIREPRVSPAELVDAIAADPNRVSPSEFARFFKLHGDEGGMAVGDEYVIRMPGPWDGPVRVVDRRPASFRLATLDGHLEAGQIEFRADREDGLLTFAIESWARSADRMADLLYDRLRMGKEIQLHMWTSVLERAAELAGGRLTGGVEIRTRRIGGGGAADPAGAVGRLGRGA